MELVPSGETPEVLFLQFRLPGAQNERQGRRHFRKSEDNQLNWTGITKKQVTNYGEKGSMAIGGTSLSRGAFTGELFELRFAFCGVTTIS